MNFLRRIFCIICAAAFLQTTVAAATVSSECDISDIAVPIDNTVTDSAIGQTLEIGAKSAILIEPYTLTVLYEMNADEVLPPASITKIMSLLLIMEAIERGDMALEDVINTSEHAAGMGGSQIWLEPGEGMTVDDLLKATVIASANDATVALGEKIAGSEEGFVAMMNERAGQLGMNNTTFINCTGLDADGHLTTAHDVALMSAELIKHPLIKKYSTVWMDSLRNGESELVNTNKLVRFYEGTTGLKTGTTSTAGYCLSATAQRDGMELVAVIMGGNSSNDRFNGAKKLLDYGFANYSFKKILPEIGDKISAPIKNGTEKTVSGKAEGSLELLMKKSDLKEITQSVSLSESIEAPIKKGDVIGSVDIFSGDTQLGSIDITATQNIPKRSFAVMFRWILNGLFVL